MLICVRWSQFWVDRSKCIGMWLYQFGNLWSFQDFYLMKNPMTLALMRIFCDQNLFSDSILKSFSMYSFLSIQTVIVQFVLLVLCSGSVFGGSDQFWNIYKGILQITWYMLKSLSLSLCTLLNDGNPLFARLTIHWCYRSWWIPYTFSWPELMWVHDCKTLSGYDVSKWMPIAYT